LRVLVEKLHVRVGRCRVEIKVILLDVFAVIAFVAREPEEPFFEDRILAVPKRQGKADVLVAIANAADAVFTPTVSAAARVIVRQVFPGVSMRAVVLAHRAPLALGQIGAPALPVRLTLAILL
jgi:hypothetical protein